MKVTLGASVAALGAMLMLAPQPAESRTATKAAAESVTLTGCLHANGGKYMLTDLKGDKAPASRSWKTVWIKKSTKDVEVVSEKSGPKLKDHVGHQVTLTGVRNGETQMQARSIKHVSGSCS